jgi:late competence protein required for DNA uptake (superfamily II DNA/RNA helicase)
MPLRGSEQILGSGQPGDTHDTLIVAPSGCGKTELIKRALLKFWHSFNNISLLSPSLDPSIGIAPEDGDWLLLK